MPSYIGYIWSFADLWAEAMISIQYGIKAELRRLPACCDVIGINRLSSRNRWQMTVRRIHQTSTTSNRIYKLSCHDTVYYITQGSGALVDEDISEYLINPPVALTAHWLRNTYRRLHQDRNYSINHN